MTTMLIENARIWTGDAAAPWADAAVVQGGRFAFVGRRGDANAAAAEIFAARGRLVISGFTDGHAHLMQTGFAMHSVALKGASTPEVAARRVAERAAGMRPGAWIRGAGWDQNDWPRAAFPDRRLLDAAVPDHPVLLTHTSGHCVWVNSAALAAAGITAMTEAPYGGAIDIGDDGEPTGILRDTAATLVARVAPPPTPDERLAGFNDAIAHAHSLGVTGAHAMDVGRGEYQAMLALRDSGRLRLRIRAFLTATRLDEWCERNIRTGDGDDMMRIGGIKFFADGALGSMTAWMLAPYRADSAPTGAGGWKVEDGQEAGTDVGLALQPPEELEARVRQCLEHGLATAIHAIGDRANREVLDIIERTQQLAPHLPRRIEHAQLVDARDLPRFGALNVTASVQPIHATQDMRKVDRSWGERGRTAYAFDTLQRLGANLAFGSDTPVETMDPLAGVHAAVTRRNAAGDPEGGWYPGERIGVAAAVAAYTSGCARAVGEEATLGRIAPGYHADFVVLSQNIFGLSDPMDILRARVDLTTVAGEIVYRNEHADL